MEPSERIKGDLGVFSAINLVNYVQGISVAYPNRRSKNEWI